MATETFTRLVDDLDGSKAERTVDFSWEGKSYSIDLSRKNIAALQKSLQPYLEAARKTATGGAGQGRRRRSGATGRPARRSAGDMSAVRAWARANGYEVSDRGRIGADIVSAFEAAK